MDSWSEFKNIYESYTKQKESLEQNILKQYEDIERLSNHIAEQEALEKQKKNSLWYRILVFFHLNSLAREIKNLKKELQDKELIHNQAKESLQTFLNNQDSNKLLSLSDGKTIGDGRSDFTREITSYTLYQQPRLPNP
ncbi:hypothetical protein [Helicobacter mesocricetorum]|uniref:hypothetical protein n=1 Tax=Helicobacter mesocricetorum TaxID=87012 RepID=UPI000CF0EE5D|nr:hypothetical protein [Helicobacter mesocricetorum]